MNSLFSSTFSLGVTYLQRTAVVAICGLAGWRLWTSMKCKPTLVVFEPAEPIAPLPSSTSPLAASEPVEPAAILPSPPSHRPSFDVHDSRKQRRKRKKKKSVRFDTVKNTLHRYTPVTAKFVTFHHKNHWVLYCHEVDPAGYDTLHCRKTKYIRDVPDLDLVDDDGDIDME
ncbi:MAG: hypothetical protein Q9186_001532 [Xanthomendoza sp. 1 TL-2023]